MREATLASIFRALSDPVRLRIVALLLGGEMCVCDIVRALRVPQPAASRHLGELKRAGLVVSREEWRWSYYRLAPARGAAHGKALACIACCAPPARKPRAKPRSEARKSRRRS